MKKKEVKACGLYLLAMGFLLTVLGVTAVMAAFTGVTFAKVGLLGTLWLLSKLMGLVIGPALAHEGGVLLGYASVMED